MDMPLPYYERSRDVTFRRPGTMGGQPDAASAGSRRIGGKVSPVDALTLRRLSAPIFPRHAISGQCSGRCRMNQYEDLLVDALLDRGFTVAEAERLIALQERIERERHEEEERRKFTEWMARITGMTE